jgi:rubredoxin
MAQATCLNESCERRDWTLRKHPADYKGGVSCPDCGTTRVDVEGGEERGRAPARQGGGQDRGGAPARGRAGESDVLSDVFAVADNDVPTQRRAQAASNVLGGLGNAVQKFMQYQEQKRQAAEKRAAEVELVETDLPTCKRENAETGSVCGYQFGPEDIGVSNERVRCPECGAVYDLAGRA